MNSSRHAMAPIREDWEKLCRILDSLGDGIFVCDPGGSIIEANETACTMFALSRDELIGRGLEHLSTGDAPYGQSEALAWLDEARTSGAAMFEWRCRATDGRTFWGEVSLRCADLGGGPVAFAVLRDITERKLREERLAESVRRDLLTGLPNRRDFIDILQNEVARYERYGGYLCVALGEIDPLIGVTGRLGQHGGDVVLVKLAEFIRARLRKSDYVARWSDVAFAMLIHDTKPDNATRMLNRMRTGLEDHAAVEFGRPVSLRFGVTGYKLSDTADGLVERVGRALAFARQGGGNRVVTA